MQVLMYNLQVLSAHLLCVEWGLSSRGVVVGSHGHRVQAGLPGESRVCLPGRGWEWLGLGMSDQRFHGRDSRSKARGV